MHENMQQMRFRADVFQNVFIFARNKCESHIAWNPGRVSAAQAGPLHGCNHIARSEMAAFRQHWTLYFLIEYPITSQIQQQLEHHTKEVAISQQLKSVTNRIAEPPNQHNSIYISRTVSDSEVRVHSTSATPRSLGSPPAPKAHDPPLSSTFYYTNPSTTCHTNIGLEPRGQRASIHGQALATKQKRIYIKIKHNPLSRVTWKTYCL